jgi:hypothetical protein
MGEGGGLVTLIEPLMALPGADQQAYYCFPGQANYGLMYFRMKCVLTIPAHDSRLLAASGEG